MPAASNRIEHCRLIATQPVRPLSPARTRASTDQRKAAPGGDIIHAVPATTNAMPSIE